MIKAITKIMKTIFITSFILILVGVAVLAYAIKIEPFLLSQDMVTLETDFVESLKMVQISDIQISENYGTEHLKKVIEVINQQEPDICLFTGDLYENYAQYHSDKTLIQLLSSIETKYGKFAVWGNRDYGGGAARKYENIMQKSGFQLLRNEAISIMLNNEDELLLAGLDDALLGNSNIEPILAKVSQDENQYSILMIHEPDVADSYADDGFDLIISGHSHGGQVDIPFFPKMTTSMAKKYIKGLYQLNFKTNLYVNSGIGTSRYPIRFRVPPEITIFNLEKEE